MEQIFDLKLSETQCNQIAMALTLYIDTFRKCGVPDEHLKNTIELQLHFTKKIF